MSAGACVVIPLRHIAPGGHVLEHLAGARLELRRHDEAESHRDPGASKKVTVAHDLRRDPFLMQAVRREVGGDPIDLDPDRRRHHLNVRR